ncbi:hypothetical protein [Aeromonas rivipollensis]|uniref:hypothetical protein n=1 Tax=Aeromonas rivipollensis TaxID=948519 RepID=UPI001F217677|nr:hypothetical protein [Aeromonas rivipollensis]MCE9955987.1 hypothetical protein [Aeromonas rivipollensis]
MSKYGKEPWEAVEVNRDEDELIQIRASNGGIIARLWIDVDDREFSDEQRDNARRIVACVNACRGLPTDELEQKGLVAAVGAELLELEQQRDELLAALVAVQKNDADGYLYNGTGNSPVKQLVESAIARAKDGAA